MNSHEQDPGYRDFVEAQIDSITSKLAYKDILSKDEVQRLQAELQAWQEKLATLTT